jgi:predicted PurR-regulated permease PerM
MSPNTGWQPRWLDRTAGYSWRLIVVAAAIGLVVAGVAQLSLVVIALFLALVIAAALRPLVGTLARIMPRPLATGLGFLVALATLAGITTFVTVSVSAQVPQLSTQLVVGLNQIDRWLRNAPPPISDLDLSNIGQSVTDWIGQNQELILGQVVARFGVLTEVVATVILAIFCSVFMVNSGTSMWGWFQRQLPVTARDAWHRAALAAWRAFSGYTRGIFLVAATNGLFSGLALTIMGIPLAAPVGMLVFLGTFVPYVGAAIAMIVAVVIALAAKGMWWALAVVLLIALIGQIEGHVLQPFIMSKQVRVHPVVVALAVVAGSMTAGLFGAVVAVPVVAVVWAVFAALRGPLPDADTPDLLAANR